MARTVLQRDNGISGRNTIKKPLANEGGTVGGSSSDQALARRRPSGTGARQANSSANRWLTSRCFASSARTAMMTSRKRALGSSFQ